MVYRLFKVGIIDHVNLSFSFDYPSIRLFIHPFTHPSTHPSILPPIHSPTHPFTHPPIYPSIHSPIHSPTNPSTHPPIQTSIHTCIHPPIVPTHSLIHPPTYPSILLSIYRSIHSFAISNRFSIISFNLTLFQDGQLQSRSWGAFAAPTNEMDSSKLQRIEFDQFKILFKCLTKWGRNEAGDLLALRAFRVRNTTASSCCIKSLLTVYLPEVFVRKRNDF